VTTHSVGLFDPSTEFLANSSAQGNNWGGMEGVREGE
jgi:hypothetical protein